MNNQLKPIIGQFKKHLSTLGYAKETVSHSGKSVAEYLDYLKRKELKLQGADTAVVAVYFDYLYRKPNQKRSGGLSPAYIEKHRQSLTLFYKFLDLTEQLSVPTIVFPQIRKQAEKLIKVLSKEEVKKLFSACENNLLGERNRAMLALYYGCGLRKQEGVLLNIEDIDLEKGHLVVRKSKTGHQRRVPLSDSVIKILDNYLFNVREKLVPSDKSERGVLVTVTGKRINGATAPYIIKKLAANAKIGKRPSLHTLRHSIATHLLQSGMPLESISRFLGHRSLDSTQIYTWLNQESINQ